MQSRAAWWLSRRRGSTAMWRSGRSAQSAAQTGSMLFRALPRSRRATFFDWSTSPNMWAALDTCGRWTIAPPTLPRSTVIRPSVSRMRSASLIEGFDTLNSEISSSCLPMIAPSATSPDMMRCRRTSATISASRGWRRCVLTM